MNNAETEVSMLATLNYRQVVGQLLEALNMGRSVDDLLAAMYENLTGVVPFNRIGVAVLDDAGETLRLISCRSDGPTRLQIGYSAPMAGSTLQRLLAANEPRIINDLEAYLAAKQGSPSTALIIREGMRSSLTLPLLADGQPIGVVFFSCRERDSYSDQHIAALKPLAGHIAIGLEKARLIALLRRRSAELAAANRAQDTFLDTLRKEVETQTEQLRRSEARYRTLVRLGRIVSASLDLRQVFYSAAEEIHTLLSCDRVSLLMPGERAGTYVGFALEFGPDQRWLDIPASPLAGTTVAWVLANRQPRILSDGSDATQTPDDAQLSAQGYRTAVCLPLVCRQASVGALGIASRQDNQIAAWDMELLGQGCEQLATSVDNAAAYGEIARLKAQVEEQNVYLRDEIKTAHDVGNIIGNSSAMQRVRAAIRQVAQTDSTVLVFGETGTGKELIARAIHELSPRSAHLLVKVNCAALAPSLIASELFGHEAGAFTGATGRRQGRFELAQQGSIFLDEIAEIPAETQVMMLRVLQERAIERVGGNQSIPIDVRVIAATNRDLKKRVEEGFFRADLFYRLNVFPIEAPALRERREDIPALINHFLDRFGRRMKKQIVRVNRRTMELLMGYDWPGNVRELENIIERAVIVSHGDTLQIDAQWLSKTEGGSPTARRIPSFAEVERQTILDALQQCGDRVYGSAGAAALLKLKPTTLYGKMRKHRIVRQRGGFETS